MQRDVSEGGNYKHLSKSMQCMRIQLQVLRGKEMKIKRFFGICECRRCLKRARVLLTVQKGQRVYQIAVCQDHAWEAYESGR